MKKTIFPVVLIVLMTVSTANATSDEDGSITQGDLSQTISHKGKQKKSRFYSLRMSFGSNHRLNMEPENAEWITSLSLSGSYRLGKALGLKGWFKKLNVSGSWSLSNEIVGNSSQFRTSYFSNPEFLSQNPTYLGVDDGILTDKEIKDVPRRVDGTQKRVDYSDVVLGISHGDLVKLPWELSLGGSIKFVLPISLQSRNKDLTTKIDYSLSLGKSFKLSKDTTLAISYDFGFTHYFYKYITPSISHLDQPIDVNGQQYDTYTYPTTGRNTEFGFNNGIGLSLTYKNDWSFSSSYTILTMRSYKWEDCEYTLDDGQVINVCDTTNEVRGYDDGGRGRRDYQMFNLAVSYKYNSYLFLSGSLTTFTPQLKPDAHTYQQPFISFNRNNYSSFLFRVTIKTEKMYDELINNNNNE